MDWISFNLLYALPTWIILTALILAAVERLKPFAKTRRIFSLSYLSDIANTVVFTYAGVFFYWLATTHIEPHLFSAIGDMRFLGKLQILASAPLWLQVLAALIVIDLGEYWVHRLLHRVSFLWQLHKVHHSVRSDEFDHLVGFRFHWLEYPVYRTLLYIPIFIFAVRWEALLILRVATVISGMFIHSNLKISLGKLGYLFNTPHLHRWHHDVDLHDGKTFNFGTRLSCWDSLFGTLYYPAGHQAPKGLGYEGQQEMFNNVLGHQLFPLLKRRGKQ